MKKFTLAASAIMLTACATTEVRTRVATDLKALQFNEISSTYLPRPTFVKIIKWSENKEPRLYITRDNYSSTDNVRAITNGLEPDTTTIPFNAEHAKEAIVYIDKYFEWLDIAIKDKDQLDKDIGETSKNVHFAFYSGNEYSHMLSVTKCFLAECGESLYFNSADARILRNLFEDFINGEIKAEDLNQKYQ